MAKDKKEKNIIIVALLIVVVSMSIGFAILSTNLNINGTAEVKANTWDVHFENVQVTSGSVTAAENKVTKPAALATGSTTLVEYEVTLSKPGDFYEFTVDVVNGGSIDAEISALPTITGVSADQDVYVNYTVEYAQTYSDVTNGTTISAGDKLVADTTNNANKKTYKVRVEYDSTISNNQLLTTTTGDQTLHLVFAVNYQQWIHRQA